MRTTMSPALFALAVGAVLSLGSAAANSAWAQSIDLSYSWPRGLVLQYDVHTEMQQETAAPGVSAGSQMVADSELRMEVVNERRGDGVVQMTTQELKLNADLGPLGEVRFDSRNARDQRRRDDPDVAPFVFLLGKPITVTLSPAGEVKRLEGYTEPLNAMLRSLPDPASRAALQASLNESIFRTNLEQTWHVLPGDVVDVGDSWPVRISQEVAGVGEVVIDMTYKLESLENEQGTQVATISARGRTRIGRATPGLHVRISDSVIEGEITVAADIGVLLDMDVTNSMVFDMSGPAGAISLSIDASTQLELKDMSGLEATASVPDVAPSSVEPRRAVSPPGASQPGGKPN